MSDKDDIWFVYILQSEMDKTFYVGISINVDNRIKEHNNGKSKYTKARRPWKLIHFEKANSRLQAREIEKLYKTTRGKKKILEQINHK